MAQIIAVDDDADLLRLVRIALEKDGHTVIGYTDPAEVDEEIWAKADLVLLDIMLPHQSGFELCRNIRSQLDCPILFLSARSEDEMMIEGLGLGADDYLTKPFSLSVLRSRIQAHLRREHRRLWDYACDWQLDPYQQICFQGHPLNLTSSEKEILMALRRQPGRIWTKEQLLALINGWDRCSEPAAMTEHIKNIRSKCRKWHSDPIETVWGIGYRWKNEDAEKPKP